jgi:NAD-dependent histone deacetylase SIR2
VLANEARIRNKRQRGGGELIPKILFNEDSVEHSREDKALHQMISADGRAELLLVVGTTLRIHGIAKLVKELSLEVRSRGGAVVYVNRDPLPASAWAKHIDLYIETDIDEWARDMLPRISKVRKASLV